MITVLQNNLQFKLSGDKKPQLFSFFVQQKK